MASSDLKGKTVLLTGASGGVGWEAARLLGSRGARIGLAARRTERLQALADEIVASGGARPVVLAADLGRRGEASLLAARAQEALGDIDVLINAAGGALQALTWIAGDRDEARDLMETNLWSPLALAAALAPRMLARGSGMIVNVGSMARVSPFPHLGHYAASRAAISAATLVMQMELAPRGIRVLEFALGPVDSPASRETRQLKGSERWLNGPPKPSTVGAAAAALVAAVADQQAGVVYHPDVFKWIDRFPALGRRFAKRLARGADLDDRAVRVAGSGGDASMRRLHEEWTVERGASRPVAS
ncbi:MAG: SDR family NAD(P)-dependent oxidoreductase [Phenylobacterium sp.]|uniref:SDR family NAD(P)-dependent oxidoreductase n=1 Tax=Phenylobacterium sp. TaxID=1871053 RepID=UPI0017C59F08|nr:SDR family NAD(P)-dependent oxidoreductase [Phenylobacterium sp.]MBA4793664.1 SDR family NAD(P)-dependent oxidoreductase [Phenylobacterium sp.]